MYINIQGNVFAICTITSDSMFVEEFGEYKKDMTTMFASCKEQTPDGLMTVFLKLSFYGNMAIPASKIGKGACVAVAGREKTREYRAAGKNQLERNLMVEWWVPRNIDPLGAMAKLKAIQEANAGEMESRKQFAHYLNMSKTVVQKWALEAMDSGNANTGGNE